jgi:DNA-binding response OmpR family regulator
MPGRDGFSLLREVRSLPELHDVPAIAVTGHAQPELLARAASTGFQRFMRKPVNLTDLCDAIRTLAHTTPRETIAAAEGPPRGESIPCVRDRSRRRSSWRPWSRPSRTR